MLHRVFLVTAVLLSQVTYAAQPDLETRVAQQVERIKTSSGPSESLLFDLPATPHGGRPVAELISYGMEAIPHLAPYLSDSSLTQTFRAARSGRKSRVAVSVYVLHVINKIADHNFAPTYQSDGLPDTEALQGRVLSWWRENRSKSLLERKIEDVDDPDHSNRFSAYEWLGRERAARGRPALERRINTLLEGGVDSLKQSEMAACADSLARIGDRDSAPAVRRVCDHLSYWFGMSHMPVEEGRSGGWSGQVAELFRAHRALALLGFKDEALSALRGLEAKYLDEMEPSGRREFLLNLERAEQW